MKTIDKQRPSKWFLNYKELMLGILAILMMIGTAIYLGGKHHRLILKMETSTLETVLRTVQDDLHRWINGELDWTLHFASDPVVEQAVQELLALDRSSEVLRRSAALKRLRQKTAQMFAYHDGKGIFVIAPDRISLASLRDENIGTVNLIEKHYPARLQRAFDGEAVLIPSIPSDVPIDSVPSHVRHISMFTAVPVLDENGEVIAVLTIRFDPSHEFSRILRLAQIGGTGETYAFDEQGIMVSESRFDHHLQQIGLVKTDKSAIANIRVADPGVNLLKEKMPEKPIENWPLTMMAASAVNGNNGSNTQGYRDYRGVAVIGAWVWNEQLEIGLTTEMDLTEALAPYYEIQKSVVGGTLAASVLLLVLAGAITLLRHRSEQQIAKREAFLNQVINLVPHMIFAKRNDGSYLLANQATAEFFGMEIDEIIGQCLSDFYTDPESIERILDADHRVITTKDTVHMPEAAFIDHLGNQRIMALTKIPFQDPWQDQPAVLGTAIDITELLTAKETAESASRAKGDFLDNINHEIRTPINAIMGMNHLLSQSDLSKKQSRYVKKQKEATTCLMGVIDEIFDFAELEHGKLKIKKALFNLNDVLNHVADVMDHQVLDKGMKLIIKKAGDVQEMLIGDAMRLAQVLVNLAENAVKFSESGDVTIAVVVKERHAHVVLQFSVIDTGTGMTSDQIAGLFQSFSQVDMSSTRKHGGTGLGLALCRQLVEMMQGEIWVDSAPGNGSTFFFTASFDLQDDDHLKMIPPGDVTSMSGINHEQEQKSKNSSKDVETEDVAIADLDISDIEPRFKELAQLLAENDTEAVEYLDIIMEKVKGTQVTGSLEPVRRLVEQYDFDGALEILKKVMDRFA